MTPLFAIGPLCCMIPILLGIAVAFYLLTVLREETPPPPPPDPNEVPPTWPPHWPRPR